MKFDRQTMEYLRGEKFSNGLYVKYDYYDVIPNRIRLLADLVRGKNVLHLGCLDHLPLIDSKIANGQWLHKEITETALSCLGIDINVEVMNYVREKHAFDNIIAADITGAPIPEVINTHWDLAILGELLEHIDNPVEYLSRIRANYTGVIDKVIITVPNVLMQKSVRAMRNSTEVINSDHRYWFTPYTIAKVILQAGMEPEEILFGNRVPLTFAELVQKKLIKFSGREPRYPFTYASSIVAIARVKR